MPHILKNDDLEIHIDLPLENYNFSRFDWTGKVAIVKYQDIIVSGVERTEEDSDYIFGRGYYNEFGIDSALGFEETAVGDWFHKIGVGLLRKDGRQYLFSHNYSIKPAQFQVVADADRILTECKSQDYNGYSYTLKKEIKLLKSSFAIHYFLQNTGDKEIKTSEYNHNFLSIDNDLIGNNYLLKFPYQLNMDLFGEIVNPEGKVAIMGNEIRFTGCPDKQFFFSNLSGSKNVDAAWELINVKTKIGITEVGNFQSNRVNLWGWKHVISPELFIDIVVQPGQTAEWSRTYKFFNKVKIFK